MKVVIYLVEKLTGLKDQKGVEMYYTVAARLTRGKAESDFARDLSTGNVRVRKIIAIK